jgi:F-type H+-transporting ATPase subunit b
MLIDWFTVVAQMLNFLILVWLLKHFLYKPILNAIDAREKRIAAELADATAKKTDAEKARDDFQSKNKAFDEQRSTLLAKATQEAKAERERLLGEAQKEADSLRAAQATALRNDHVKLGSEITRLATEQVFGIARKTLADLATVSLEERIGEVFTRRLREMNGKAKQALGDALKASPDASIVRCAFDLLDEQKAAIQNALNETFSAEIRIRFETSQAQICGIELTANGQKISWSIADYLKTLDQKVGALLDAQSVPSKPVPKPEPASAPEPKPEAASAPVPKPEPASATEPKAETASAPVPKPEAASATEPKAETASAPVPKPEPASATEPKAETVSAPVPKPEAASAPEPKPETASVPVPKPEAASASAPNPAAPVEAK